MLSSARGGGGFSRRGCGARDVGEGEAELHELLIRVRVRVRVTVLRLSSGEWWVVSGKG
jgi:hypothetical protein